ncbi:hypothetical protein M406DRAFT_357106 [Cryphonectria parasitica EP155]|uniref:Uncharacterized protein n=1 Tax=Cryphonectria parasitica (strain ATCC 38755 / EP155) TaxID=660469 RepID=A0A9P4XY76_CRYP1|nr:uncharacterized protein M406DRAFT_357106 [Cryphonectria parasitica EP155]KAF3763522.1 hypothetical protein M406DRAFT_357106 [Cryphonectria parasitica EP155]
MPEQSPPPYNGEAKRRDDDGSDRPPPKRQRVDPGRIPCEDAGDDAGDAVRKLCHELMAQHQLALRSEFLAGQTALRTEILGELKQMEERVLHATRHFVSEQINGLKTEVADDIQGDVAVEVTVSVLDQVRDEYELYIDDRVDGIKLEMEASVKDEMESAQDDIINRFQEGTWQFRSS